MKIGDFIIYNKIVCQITQLINNDLYVMCFDNQNNPNNFLINDNNVIIANNDDIISFNTKRDRYITTLIDETKKTSNNIIRNILSENYDWRLIRNERKKYFNEPLDDLSKHHLEANKILLIYYSYCNELDLLVPFNGIGLPEISTINEIPYIV
jgi:hypothetical protein